MADEEQVAILRDGVKAWNQWKKDNEVITANLNGVDLSSMNLSFADFSRTNLRWANLSDSSLLSANFTQANLSEAKLNGADLSWATLRMTDLTEAILINAVLLGADLSQAKLGGTALNQALLHHANLSQADISAADLSRTNLVRADLSWANLSQTILAASDLSEANLSDAILHRADLREAKLNSTDLSRAILSRAKLGYTTLGDVDLSSIFGLETIEHFGPSVVGIDAIYRSQGEIPEQFLRDAGTPDSFITYMKSLTGTAFEFYSCFISFSTHDQDFAERLHADLRNKGVSCWFAPNDMKTGEPIRQTIHDQIRLHEKLLLVLSEHSINSRWVETEVENALDEEDRQQKLLLFPVRLDDAVMKTETAWVAIIRRRHITDFSRWKNHDDYLQSFERLLRDLKTERTSKEDSI